MDWRVDDADVVIRVTDSGPGVPPEIKDRIFDPFFTTKASGTGLGLAVAREIAEAQGGHVVLESGPTRGASFALRLPRVDGSST